MKNLKVTLLILPLLMAVPALAQNDGYTDYFTYTAVSNADGSATVTPTAEVTGTDDLSDWQENGYRPLCSLTPKIQLTGDSNWIPGYGAALGKTVDFVHTGQPIQVPADGSDESIQFSVEVLAHCAGAVGFYEYPVVGSLDSWSYIDPYDWLLEGFEPGQTDPPSDIQYCADGDACQVGEWEVPPTNFVDFADFADWDISVGVRISQWQFWTGQTTPGPADSCAYHALCNSSCYKTGDTKFILGTQWPAQCPAYYTCEDAVLIINGKIHCLKVSNCDLAPNGSGPCS